MPSHTEEHRRRGLGRLTERGAAQLDATVQAGQVPRRPTRAQLARRQARLGRGAATAPQDTTPVLAPRPFDDAPTRAQGLRNVGQDVATAASNVQGARPLPLGTDPLPGEAAVNATTRAQETQRQTQAIPDTPPNVVDTSVGPRPVGPPGPQEAVRSTVRPGEAPPTLSGARRPPPGTPAPAGLRSPVAAPGFQRLTETPAAEATATPPTLTAETTRDQQRAQGTPAVQATAATGSERTGRNPEGVRPGTPGQNLGGGNPNVGLFGIGDPTGILGSIGRTIGEGAAAFVGGADTSAAAAERITGGVSREALDARERFSQARAQAGELADPQQVLASLPQEDQRRLRESGLITPGEVPLQTDQDFTTRDARGIRESGLARLGRQAVTGNPLSQTRRDEIRAETEAQRLRTQEAIAASPAGQRQAAAAAVAEGTASGARAGSFRAAQEAGLLPPGPGEPATEAEPGTVAAEAEAAGAAVADERVQAGEARGPLRNLVEGTTTGTDELGRRNRTVGTGEFTFGDAQGGTGSVDLDPQGQLARNLRAGGGTFSDLGAGNPTTSADRIRAFNVERQALAERQAREAGGGEFDIIGPGGNRRTVTQSEFEAERQPDTPADLARQNIQSLRSELRGARGPRRRARIQGQIADATRELAGIENAATPEERERQSLRQLTQQRGEEEGRRQRAAATVQQQERTSRRAAASRKEVADIQAASRSKNPSDRTKVLNSYQKAAAAISDPAADPAARSQSLQPVLASIPNLRAGDTREIAAAQRAVAAFARREAKDVSRGFLGVRNLPGVNDPEQLDDVSDANIVKNMVFHPEGGITLSDKKPTEQGVFSSADFNLDTSRLPQGFQDQIRHLKQLQLGAATGKQ